jgi:hypothetical protein
MNPELIKQAYAYGAAVALQELGFDIQQAQAGGVKLAEDAMFGEDMPEQAPGGISLQRKQPTRRSSALATMFGPVGAAITAPKGKKFDAVKGTAIGELSGGLKGLAAGGTAGAGLGALAALLSRGKIKPSIGATVGGLGGVTLGATGGALYGRNKGYRAALEE